jgi:hypothetical protein
MHNERKKRRVMERFGLEGDAWVKMISVSHSAMVSQISNLGGIRIATIVNPAQSLFRRSFLNTSCRAYHTDVSLKSGKRIQT